MTSLSEGIVFPSASINDGRVLDFRTNDTVHHLNYFQQKKTIEFLERTLLGA